MAALVESMFSVREVPWHGLGTIIDKCLNTIGQVENTIEELKKIADNGTDPARGAVRKSAR